VYLLRVVVGLAETKPSAKMPIVLLPAAEPPFDAAVAAPAKLATQFEYVYLLRVVSAFAPVSSPNAKIANVPVGGTPAIGHSPCFVQ
jgi:hypothetical protein